MPSSSDKNVTIESILGWFEEQVRHGHPISTACWLDGASKVVSLLQNFNEGCICAEMEYRGLRASFIANGDTSATAEARAKATPVYAKYLRMSTEKKRIESWIQLCKKRTEVKMWDV
jgi:hypothetical protein